MIKTSIHKEADLRDKLTTPGFVLERLVKSQSFPFHLIKLALRDLECCEREFGLKEKLSRIRTVLENLSESKQPSQESIKLATEDFEFIKNSLT